MQADPATNQEKAVRELFDQLDDLGVQEYVVCAGARNAALVQVLAARAEALPQYVLTRFFDERSAAFFALGRVMHSRRPVAVFTTSGTAVAELLPAIVEAYYQRLPLVAVTADRPAEYAGSGAPQAIEQEGLFGLYANQLRGGPIHLNVRLEELALSVEALMRCSELRSNMVPDSSEIDDAFGDAVQDWPEFWQDTSPLIVLAAGLSTEEASRWRSVLARLQAPIVAEATANLHGFPELDGLLIRGGERALQRLNAGRVLRVGAVPSWRWWRDLEKRPEVKVLNVTRCGFRGLARTQQVKQMSWTTFLHSIEKLKPATSDSLLQENEINFILKRLLQKFPNSETAWMGHLAARVGQGAQVFLGNSLPIREWNLGAKAIANDITFWANRGANGIDGLISTWLGTSANAAESWLIVGDLSALYDANALWVVPQLKQAKRKLVVINNGGGQIFSRVGWLNTLPKTARDVMMNPHHLDFSAWAKMWGVGYRCLNDCRQIADLQDSDSGLEIWEIKPDPEQTNLFWREWS